MMNGKVILTAILVVGLSGCATKGVNTVSYTKHTPTRVTNEIVVNQTYLQVWDKLVRELSKSFYVINNIDKESRIINLSFSSQSPVDFIDCGEAHRTYTHGSQKEKFDYNVADSANYKFATGAKDIYLYYAHIRRTTSLEGRANIYLAPLEGDKTKTTVAVNSRYVLTIDTAGDSFAQPTNNILFNGNSINQGPLPQSRATVITLSTNNPTEHNFGDDLQPATCFSKGKLEQDVLMRRILG